jgi:uncharacterized protein (TIGR02145 family)
MSKYLIVCIVILAASCGKNHPPVIEIIRSLPETGNPGTVFNLSVEASDPDGDKLIYSWRSDAGSFVDSANQAQTKWKAPISGNVNAVNITVDVSDGQSTTTGNHQVKLSLNIQPVISDIRSYPTVDVGGALFVVKVIASDPENDPLTYDWSCSEGEVTEGKDRSLAKWQSPLNEIDKTYTIQLALSDGIHNVDTVLLINVLKSPGGDLVGNTFFNGCTIPIDGVSLTIGDKTAVSDSTGHFHFSDIPFGSQTVVAIKQDFNRVSSDIFISSGLTTSTDLHLSSEKYSGHIHGVIKDQEGKPVSESTIVLLNPDQSESGLMALSDGLGKYRLNDVPLGERSFLARKDNDQSFRYVSVRLNLRMTDHETPLDIEVQKVSLVPSVTTRSVTGISYNYSICGGEVTYDGESAILKRGVCWSLNQNPTISDSKTSNGTGTGIYESNLLGLESGTTYYVRAYATNGNGKTGYGEELIFITIPNGTFTDARDQKIYKTVEIGGQTWMAGNLNFASPSGSWCYDDKPANCAEYGRLYNWNAVINVGSGKDICPAGWRAPTDAEWASLLQSLGEKALLKIKSVSGWRNNSNGDNSSGFNAKPGGFRFADGTFDSLNSAVSFWTITSDHGALAWKYILNSAVSNIIRFESGQSEGSYLRCIKF